MVQHRKKTLKTGLTASRKKARRPGGHDAFETFDALNDCCRTIATVAALLEVGNEFAQPEVVHNAGSLIADAERELKALLETVRQETAR